MDTTINIPDLFLAVRLCRDSESMALCFELSSREDLEGAHGDLYGPWPLQNEPNAVFEPWLYDLQNLALDGRQDPAAVLRRLRAKGARLFKMLFPENLREVLWKLRSQVETFAIVSEVRGIPWELLRFHGRPDDPEAEGPFFAEAFALFRGLPGLSETGLPAPRLGPLHDLALIVHQGEDFQQERRAIEALLEGRIGVTVVEPKATDLLQALGSDRFDAFHFAGHGSAAGHDPGSWTLSVGDEEKVHLEEVETTVRGFARSRPLVFLNACETGRMGLALGGLEGWVSCFLTAGASAFIGTHWEVPGDKALVFADVFYRRFIGGMPFGEAVRRARSELRDRFPEDPTWLAYAVYGHPASRCGEEARGLPATISRPTLSRGPTASKEPTPWLIRHRARLTVAAVVAVFLIAMILAPGLFTSQEPSWTLRVADRRGQPVRGAEVVVFSAAGTTSTFTDSYGAAEFVALSDTSLPRLVVQAPEYEIFETSLDPSRERLIQVQLEASRLEAGKVLFRLVDAVTAEPIPNAEVLLFQGAEIYPQMSDNHGLVKYELAFASEKADIQLSVQTAVCGISHQRITLRPDQMQDVLLDCENKTLNQAPLSTSFIPARSQP